MLLEMLRIISQFDFFAKLERVLDQNLVEQDGPAAFEVLFGRRRMAHERIPDRELELFFCRKPFRTRISCQVGILLGGSAVRQEPAVHFAVGDTALPNSDTTLIRSAILLIAYFVEESHFSNLSEEGNFSDLSRGTST